MDVKDLLELFNTVCIVLLGICVYFMLGNTQELNNQRQAEAKMYEQSYKRMADKITELEGTQEQHAMAINGMGMAVIKLIEKENNTTY